MKFIIYILLCIVCLSSVCALDWKEAKTYITKISFEDGFGKQNIRYAPQDIYQESNKTIITYAIMSCKDKDCMITYYKPAFDLTKEELQCITHHEVGHYKEFKIIYKGKSINLSESYANDYMQNKDKNCLVRYSE